LVEWASPHQAPPTRAAPVPTGPSRRSPPLLESEARNRRLGDSVARASPCRTWCSPWSSAAPCIVETRIDSRRPPTRAAPVPAGLSRRPPPVHEHQARNRQEGRPTARSSTHGKRCSPGERARVLLLAAREPNPKPPRNSTDFCVLGCLVPMSSLGVLKPALSAVPSRNKVRCQGGGLPV